MRKQRLMAVLASVAAGALVATGCTVDGGSDDEPEAGGGSIEKIDGIEDATIAMGSKEFDEQLVLGQIGLKVLHATGADPKDNTNITGSDVVRKSLTSGEIDLYWEYTGTAWVSFLKQTKTVTDSEKLFEEVASMDAENDITWWARSPANNTYAIAGNADAVEEHGIETLSDYAELVKSDPEAAATCMGPEFGSRDDGFPGLSKAYGFELPKENQKPVADAVVYEEAGKGESCNFGSVAATDGRIAAQDLVVLEDDQSFFPIYNPAISIRTELAEEFPELEDVFTSVAEKLDDETLLDLNKKVSVDGEDPAAVASDWLTDEGFIG